MKKKKDSKPNNNFDIHMGWTLDLTHGPMGALCSALGMDDLDFRRMRPHMSDQEGSNVNTVLFRKLFISLFLFLVKHFSC